MIVNGRGAVVVGASGVVVTGSINANDGSDGDVSGSRNGVDSVLPRPRESVKVESSVVAERSGVATSAALAVRGAVAENPPGVSATAGVVWGAFTKAITSSQAKATA